MLQGHTPLPNQPGNNAAGYSPCYSFSHWLNKILLPTHQPQAFSGHGGWAGRPMLQGHTALHNRPDNNAAGYSPCYSFSQWLPKILLPTHPPQAFCGGRAGRLMLQGHTPLHNQPHNNAAGYSPCYNFHIACPKYYYPPTHPFFFIN